MRKYFLLALLIPFLLSGCQTWNRVFPKEPKIDWEAKKAELDKEYKDKYDKAVEDLNKKQTEKENAEKKNLQKSSGLAYGILLLSEIKAEKERNRVENLTHYKAKELLTRLPYLTMEDMLYVNDELKTELDEKATTILDLQKKYDAALVKAKEDQAAIEAIQKEIDAKKLELTAIEGAKKDADLALEQARRKVAEIESNKLLRDKERDERMAELIKYLIRIFIGIGIAAAVAAYAMRSLTLAAASAGALGLAVAMPFIEPWMVIAAGSIIILAAIAGIGIKLYRTHQAGQEEKAVADRLVGSIEEYKNKLGESRFKTEMGPVIDGWIKDMPKFKDKIEAKLKELNLK